MGITNMYPNLPGHLVEFKDGGLQLTSLPEDGSGYKKSLLILGTALDGPINEPVKIDAKTVTQLFGSEVNDKNYPNGTTLTKYAKQAFAHGFTDVRCMRVTGSEASRDIVVSTNNSVAHVPKILRIEQPIAGHPSARFCVANQEDNDGAYLPIANNDEHYGIDICLLPPRADGSLQQRVSTDGVSYFPSLGEVQLKADVVTKNSVIYAVFWHQNILGKDETHGGSAEYLDEVIVNGVPATVVNASDFGPETSGVVFQLKYPSAGVKPYVQAYDSDGEVLEASCYPQIWQTILQDDEYDMTVPDAANLAVTAAKAKAKNLKVMISGTYEDADGVSHTRILDASEFAVNDDNGNVVIANGIYTAQVANPAYDPDDPLTTEPATISADMPYTSYTVKYLVYKDDRVVNAIDLANVGGTKAVDDEFSLNDSGEALPESIEVYTNNGSLKFDSAKYSVGKDASNIHTVVKIPAGNAPVGTRFTIKYEVIERATSEKVVTFKSIYGGEVYNQARIKMEKMRDILDQNTGTVGEEYIKITFCKPESKYYSKTEVPFYYKSTDVPTVGQLRDFLKNYELNNVFAIETDDDDITLEELYDAVCRSTTPPEDGSGVATQAAEATVSVDFALGGGSNGVNPTDEELFVALSGKRDSNGYLLERGAYQVLENYHCDYIYPAGAKADKKVYVNGRYQSFQYELALVCAVLTYRTKMTHGFIDVSPNSNTSLIGVQKHVDKLLAMPNLFYMQDQNGEELLDSENKPMDIGWYTSVVVGPDPVMISDTLGTYYGSAAIAYAALVASLKPQSSPMNKALPKVKGMKYKLSNKQMDALVGNRMVCFRLKNEGAATASSIPYCVDAMTSGGPECDYARMTTVSIVTDVVDQIREVADPFIGEPNTIEQRNALSALIAKRLSRIYEKGEVTYYSFEINATIQQVLLGECTISLTLVCPMELRKITTVVSLRAAA